MPPCLPASTAPRQRPCTFRTPFGEPTPTDAAADQPPTAAVHGVRSGLMNDETLEIRLLETAEQMAPIVTMFQQVWGSVIPLVGVELLRAIGHAGGYVAGAFDSGHIVGASFGFLARLRRRGRAAQPRHRDPARRPAQRRRAGDEEPPAELGRRAGADVGDVDVRSARAPQRLVQHRGAPGPRRRVPRRLLRADDRLDQRPRRVRPAAGRLADRPDSDRR